MRVGWRVGGERYVHCMYENFVFTLVKGWLWREGQV